MHERACELVFPGDNPDPAVLRHQGWWYATHSTFRHAPGLEVRRSRDLRTWEHVSFALPGGALDVWAPDLTVHQGTWLIHFFASGKTWVISAADPAGPWTAPHALEIGGIDPAHLVDDDGRRWLMMSDGVIAPLSADGRTVVGQPQRVCEPWPIPGDWVHEGVYLEGLKPWREASGWHLLAAQGGTAGPATSHMVLHARAANPHGPWTWNPHGPVLRTADRSAAWWSLGHGTLLADDTGEWLMVHGYRAGFHTLGRQSVLVPVRRDPAGWLLPVTTAVDPAPAQPRQFSDSFGELAPRWRMWGQLAQERLAFDRGLRLAGSGTSLRESAPLTFAAEHADYTIECELARPEPGCVAGLCLFYNQECFLAFTCDHRQLALSDRHWTQELDRLPADGERVRLRLRNDAHTITLAWAIADGPWQRLPLAREVSGWHHNVFGGFLALRPGIVALGSGSAHFLRFSYAGRG